MARLTVRFAGRPPYEVRVVDVAPRPGAPRVDRAALRRGARDEESVLALELPIGRYRLRLSAANAVELRWVDLPAQGARIFSDPPDEGPVTWRGGMAVRSQRTAIGGGFVSPRAVGVLLLREQDVDDDFLAALGFRRVQIEREDDGREGAALQGFIAVHERPIKAAADEALAQLRGHPSVAAAGPLHRDGAAFSLFRAHLYVKFRSGVAPDIAAGMLARLRGRGVKAVRSAPRLYRVDFPRTLGFAVNAYAAALVADHRVEFAEPGFGDRPVLHAPPADFLWPLLWDRQLLAVDAAWDLVGANAAVQVAVLDDAFTGIVEHPELNVSSEPTASGNNHGMACMGLIAAVADSDGLIGVSPDATLVPVVYDSAGTLQASIEGASAADIVSCSVGMTDYMTAVDAAALFESTRQRGGRGIAHFFSAGDSSATSLAQVSFGSSDFGFATSGVSQAGLKLTEGNAGAEMAWCAPAANKGMLPTNWATANGDAGTLPATKTWVLSVAQLDATDPNRCRVTGPHPMIYRALVIPEAPTGASLPARVIDVDDAATWAAAGGGWIRLDAPVSIGVGQDYVVGALRLGTVSANTMTGTTLLIDWDVPLGQVSDEIWIGYEGIQTNGEPYGTTRYVLVPNGASIGEAELAAPIDAPVFANHGVYAFGLHARQFGASSAANALAAGVGALALRANPELTWRELEAVLRDSAIGLGSPNDFGAGRLNALEAVKAALDYVDERADLHIRDHAGDQGDGPTVPMSPSPDIWVRNAAGAGPHEDPIVGQTNYVYVRVRNRGTRTSLPARVLLRVATVGHAPFTWPTAWLAGDTSTTKTIGDPYELGQLAPGAEAIAEFIWPASEALNVPDPWLLAEVTPQDGALAEPEVHRNTNLAVLPVSMIDSNGPGPTVDWQDALGQSLGFATAPGALSVRLVMPAGAVAYAGVHAHGRDRADDLPVALSTSTPIWNPGLSAYTFDVAVPDACAEFVLEAEVIDSLGRVAPSDQRFHRMAVRLPIQLTLLLDRSGSMSASAGADTKWAAARRAAVLFESIYDAFKAPGDVFKAIGFHHTGGAFTTTGTTLAALPAGGPTGATPLGEAILHGAADGTAGGFQYGASGERVLVLLTDGKHNRGPSLADVRADLPANPVSVKTDALNGVRIHACAFAAPGAVDTEALEGLVHGGDDPSLRSYAGRLQSTENLDDADDAGALTEMFLSVLSDVTGVEMIGPLNAANNTFVIEDGVDKFMFVAPAGPAGLTLAGPGAQASTIVEGCLQITVTGNTAGTYTLTGTPATDCFVLVDLQLTSEFTVAPTLEGGFDCAVRLLFAGQPITDARCELRARGPGESIGEAILRSGVRLNPRNKGELSRRGRLMQGTVKRRNRRLRVANTLHLLQPTGAGRFATILDGPLRTGTWSFELKVSGTTPKGAPFERLVRASRVIAARPDATTSVVQWATLPDGKQQVVITPKDARGDRLGPGLDLKTFADGIGHALVDQGDGTYAAVFAARKTLKLSKQLGARSIPAPRPQLFAVKVTVTRLRIGASHDGRAAGEWVFVSRAQVGRRRKSTRLPRRGVLPLPPGATLAPDSLVLDERVLEGERLTLAVAAFELDGRAQWTSKLAPTGPGVTRAGSHQLRLRGDPRAWAGVHRIGDRAWQVEVRVEVDGARVKPRRTPPRRP